MTKNLHLMQPPAPDDEFERHRALDDTFEQTMAARDRLYLPTSAYLTLPWPDVDGLVGGIAPGDVWFVAGFSGNGKTTWLLNLVYEYLEQGKTVYYLGLETRPPILRTHLACLRLELYAGDVLSGAQKSHPDWENQRAKLVAEFERQRALGQRDRFIVNGVPHVGEPQLREAAHDAAMNKADVIVIDHVDHLRHSGGRSHWEESVRVVHLILELAQDKNLRMLVATQCNNEGARGDRLGTYQAPQVTHVYMGSNKRMVATGMLGLYRPLLLAASKEDLADVRHGKKEPHHVLEQNTMGVVVMKHRNYGNREGMRAMLHIERGKISNMLPRDKEAVLYGGRY